MGFLAGKKVLIAGLLSNRSIAYGIAAAMKRQGAELAFTYQMEKHAERVAGLAADFDSKIDNVAAWTIGGLVAGKVLAKAGFFAIILKFIKPLLLLLFGKNIIPLMEMNFLSE